MKLEIENVRRTYGPHVALDGLSLQVASSHVLVLIGPSGGGKSTLLRVLGGLEQADSGVLRVNGIEIPKTENALISYRRGNGFLFQQFNLFPHLTAKRNIALPLEKVHGMPFTEASRTAMEALDRFGLADHANKLPSQLSGGQQQRVGLARAVARKPSVLFLDEPTSALDPEMTAEVLELIEDLARQGQDIILSTHEMGFARAVADEVVFLAAGKVVETGPPGEIFGGPRSESCARFLSRVMRY
jgi:polar amino acid transport system ATP-binding protein